MNHEEVTRARFAASAAKLAALGDRRVDALRERLRELLPLTGSERAIDVGTGTAPLAIALAPLVGCVVGVDLVPAMLEQARSRAAEHPNLELVLGDALALPFSDGAFDLATSGRTLHHLDRPGPAVDELARVVRSGGLVLVVDQIAPPDPAAAALQEEIEVIRDPSHARTLPDAELRGLLEGAGLTVERAELVGEERDLDEFLDLAGCEGAARDAVHEVAGRAVESGVGRAIDLRSVGSGLRFTVTVGWYVARRPPDRDVSRARPSSSV